MPSQPRPSDLIRIPRGLKWYRVASIITGVLLLLLVAEMVLKYGFGFEVEAFGPNGLIALTPEDGVTAVNLSTGVLIVHGWFYVVYLLASFNLWSLMRWPFLRLMLLALGGIIPGLSFVLEARYAKQVAAFLREVDATGAKA